jgi:hypothetical protein
MHAGSVDEEENERGIAHLVEHVTFLGSSKRENLIGSGARSNAYTDFHHTVFHVHSPLMNTSSKTSEPTPMLPKVLLDAIRPLLLCEATIAVSQILIWLWSVEVPWVCAHLDCRMNTGIGRSGRDCFQSRVPYEPHREGKTGCSS